MTCDRRLVEKEQMREPTFAQKRTRCKKRRLTSVGMTVCCRGGRDFAGMRVLLLSIVRGGLLDGFAVDDYCLGQCRVSSGPVRCATKGCAGEIPGGRIVMQIDVWAPVWPAFGWGKDRSGTEFV